MNPQALIRMLACALMAGAMAGCDRAPDPSPSEPARSDATPAQEAKASIIRPDVEPRAEPAPALTPLKLSIGFGDGGSELSEAAIASLEEALASRQMKAGGRITVGGHSDSAGSDAANLDASRKRAEAVRGWLVAHGIAEDRIAIVAFGEQNPAAPNALPDGQPNPAGRAMNRRVEIEVAVAGEQAPPTPAETGTLIDELAE
ncbi:hypothetical protein GCM10011515_04650 [Tsuneonella deserti]|uniref:OmpA-like domain-containing protein n=1 Tax=Tsuneonella deserti TaxID=2035528 RepID=A0ABQ1S3C3_9SPHN|nr:OmpA family protein [Tsuneonella deserti]GGD88102.1 hypothetical protein GCM10011515_04650 [Tsuneonella deserti]